MVMKLTQNADDSGPVLPLQDPNSYQEKDILTFDQAMKSQSPQPYITAEMNESAFSEDLALFVVGHPGDSLTVTNEIYKNGHLAPSSYYSVFLRAFWSEPPQVDTRCIITPHNLRPADQSVPCFLILYPGSKRLQIQPLESIREKQVNFYVVVLRDFHKMFVFIAAAAEKEPNSSGFLLSVSSQLFLFS